MSNEIIQEFYYEGALEINLDRINHLNSLNLNLNNKNIL